MTTERYPWYEVVDNNTPVLQGDFLLSCPVFIPSQGYNSVKEDETTSFEVMEYDVIVMISLRSERGRKHFVRGMSQAITF